MKKWQCSVCKYVHTGEEPPEKCPVCGVGAEKFVLLEEEDAAPETKTEAPAAEADATEESSSGKFEIANYYLDQAADLMVKHHAHPMSVHLPNGVIPVITILIILSWFSGSEIMLKASFINLIFVLLSLPVVGLTGFLEWRGKYNQAQTKIFKTKIAAAAVATTCCLVSLIWYLINPAVLESSVAWLFVLVNVLMLAGAGVAGHIGGKLVFKE